MGVAGRHQHVQCGGDICPVAADRVLDGALDGRKRSLMKHVFDSPHRGFANRKLRQVAFYQLDAVEAISEIANEPRTEVIHHSHRMVQFQESMDQRRADKPGAARHQKTCHATSLTRNLMEPFRIPLEPGLTHGQYRACFVGSGAALPSGSRSWRAPRAIKLSSVVI